MRKIRKRTETSQLILRTIPQPMKFAADHATLAFSCINGAFVLLFSNVDQLIMRLVRPGLCNLILRRKYNGLFVFPLMHPGRRIRHLFRSACFEEISSGHVFIPPIKTEAYLGRRHLGSVLG